jgi:thiol-disulfide isomerase/thioredoxin
MAGNFAWAANQSPKSSAAKDAASGAADGAGDSSAKAASEILSGVHWAGPAMDMSALHGKTVVVLVYASWCPICNKWSPEMCKQLKESIADKPVVVLAINNDETPANALKYANEHGLTGPNIVYGYDPNIHKKAGLQQLWSYMMIDPSGNISERGQAGSFYQQPGAQVFVLPKKLGEMKNLGSFTVIEPEMEPELKQALWPLEVGQPSMAAEARKALDKETKHKFDEAIGNFLTKELEAIRKLADGETEDKFQAYDRAHTMYSTYKGSDRSKEAHKVALNLEGDKKFSRELTARTMYLKIEKTVPPEKQAPQLKRMAKTFAGTVYGDKAASAN